MFDRWNDPKSVEWSKRVKERDHYTCQICKKSGVPLHSHHLNSWNLFEAQRYDINNGITLCTICHEKFHFIYKSGDNTLFQFLQFKKTVDLFRKQNNKFIK
jgi:5-methylcytosine-specific restriction endonuclease McrA